MLIFFIVTTSFVKEKRLMIQRPDQSYQTTISLKANLSIKINANGELMMNNRMIEMRRLVPNIYISEKKPERRLSQ
jgi:biopolymer transport protein ExbD